MLWLLVSVAVVAQTRTPQQMMGYFAGDWNLSRYGEGQPKLAQRTV